MSRIFCLLGIHDYRLVIDPSVWFDEFACIRMSQLRCYRCFKRAF